VSKPEDKLRAAAKRLISAANSVAVEVVVQRQDLELVLAMLSKRGSQ